MTTQSTVPTQYHELSATGHTIQQDVTFTTFATTTTIERLFRRYEDGMEGWDAELALLLPWIDRWMDVKVIGGFYSFDNQPFGPQTGGTGKVEGWKAGLEVRPVPAVVLNATWYEDDRLTGSDWTAGVRLEVPFEAGDLGDGKGFWGRIGDAFRPRRRHLAERMVEPVRRQNAAIKTSTSVEEDEEAAEVRVDTRVVSQSRRRIVLADTVVFVDNAIGNPANPGTYEAPLDTVQNGENLGNMAFGENAIVFVQGRAKAYAENVLISQGSRLFGSGSFVGMNGVAFHGRTRMMPHVSGGFVAQNIKGTVGVSGFEITSGFAGSIISGNVVSPSSVGISMQNVSNVIISGNYVHDLGGIIYSILVESVGAGQVSNAVVRNNTVRGQADGISLYAKELGHLDGLVENNVVSGAMFNGIIAGGTPNTAFGDGGTGTFTIRGNTVFGNGIGIQVASDTAASVATFYVTSNHISGNDNGFRAHTGLGGTANVILSDNQIVFNSGHQIFGREDGGDTLNFIHAGTLSNTVLESPGSPDFLYDAFSGNEGGFININGILHPAGLDLP